MTDTNDKLRALFLAGLMVLSVVAISGTAAAVNPTRTAAGNTAPITVFIGEESLDIEAATNTDNASLTLVGVAGEADGSTASIDDTGAADITSVNGFQVGGYNSSGNSDGALDISVREPEINDVTLYRGDNDDGADITGGSVPDGDNVTVEADFNFERASWAEITVEDASGVDVTDEVFTGEASVDNSGDDLTLDFAGANLDTGEYTVTVEGADEDDNPTDLSAASMTATFTIRESDTTISLDNSEVVQGETVVATVTGTPGQWATVRVDEDDTNSGTADQDTAEDVFRDTGDVENITFGNNFVGAVVDLDDEGSAQISIDASALDDGNTATIEVFEHQSGLLVGNFTDDSDDDVDLRVNAADVSIDSMPASVVVGEDFDIEGTAAESDDVKAYAKISDTWFPLLEEANTSNYAQDDVDPDGSWTLEVDSGSVIDIPDSYRVAVVADPIDDWADARDEGSITDTAGGDSSATDNPSMDDLEDAELDEDAFGELLSTSQSVRTTSGALEASLDRTTYAADSGDELNIAGTSVGQGDDVRVFVVGPRGGWDSNLVEVEDDDTFEDDLLDVIDPGDNTGDTNDIDNIDQRGSYNILVVGAGRDGDFAANVATGSVGGSNIGGASTQQQVLEVLRDEYSGAGVDDAVIELTFSATNPTISIDEVGTNGQVLQEEVTVSGTANRESGNNVLVDVVDADGNTIISGQGSVGEGGTWEATVDFSDVDTGSYTLRAEDDESSAETEIEVVTEITTETPEETTPTGPAETPTPQVVTQTVQRTVQQTVVRTVIRTPATETPSGQPGFGAIVALVALLAAALLAVRRR